MLGRCIRYPHVTAYSAKCLVSDSHAAQFCKKTFRASTTRDSINLLMLGDTLPWVRIFYGTLYLFCMDTGREMLYIHAGINPLMYDREGEKTPRTLNIGSLPKCQQLKN